jgi:DNA-binding NtrC family response regulator
VAALEAFPWPGNIRQLENALQQAVLMSKGPELQLKHLPPNIRDHAGHRLVSNGHSGLNGNGCNNGNGLLHNHRALAESTLIRQILENHGYSPTRAAKALGISRMALYKKIKKYKLPQG